MRHALRTTVDDCLLIDASGFGAMILMPGVLQENIRRECPHFDGMPYWDAAAIKELKQIATTPIQNDNKMAGALKYKLKSLVRSQLARSIQHRIQVRTVGVLRIDYTYPSAAADTASYVTHNAACIMKRVDGLFFELVQAGSFESFYTLFEKEEWMDSANTQFHSHPLPEFPEEVNTENMFLKNGYYRMNQGQLVMDTKRNFRKTVMALESEGAELILGDCGFLIYYQEDCRKVTQRALTLLSSLAALPIILQFQVEGKKTLILTANADSLKPLMTGVMMIVGFRVTELWTDYFDVKDWRGVKKFFEPLVKAERVPVDEVKPDLELWFKEPINFEPKDYYAVLLECTEMPPYRNDIVEWTKEIAGSSFMVFGPNVFSNWILGGFNRAEEALIAEDKVRRGEC